MYNPNNLQIALCPQYSYVIRSDLQPYFDIATSYHFANCMFQNNEGPSFPAHQFILSGTSAPAAPGLTDYLDFVAENAGFDKSRCPDTSQHPAWVDPTGFESQQPQSECYDHPTLGDQLKANNITWRYYTPTPGVIWTAPAAISKPMWEDRERHMRGARLRQCDLAGKERKNGPLLLGSRFRY